MDEVVCLLSIGSHIGFLFAYLEVEAGAAAGSRSFSACRYKRVVNPSLPYTLLISAPRHDERSVRHNGAHDRYSSIARISQVER